MLASDPVFVLFIGTDNARKFSIVFSSGFPASIVELNSIKHSLRNATPSVTRCALSMLSSFEIFRAILLTCTDELSALVIFSFSFMYS